MHTVLYWTANLRLLSEVLDGPGLVVRQVAKLHVLHLLQHEVDAELTQVVRPEHNSVCKFYTICICMYILYHVFEGF